MCKQIFVVPLPDFTPGFEISSPVPHASPALSFLCLCGADSAFLLSTGCGGEREQEEHKVQDDTKAGSAPGGGETQAWSLRWPLCSPTVIGRVV